MRRPSSNKPSSSLALRSGDGHASLEPEKAASHGDNAPEISVSDLSQALKRTVEERFGFVRLRGEISNYRGPHASGHAYFCLKDEGARIDAVVWKTTLARMRFKPEDGLEVIASGKITTFPGKSSYQIVVESLEPAGIGALMAVLEERRRKLAAEGLFDTGRKRPLPYLPLVIGVVTSPTGAVIRDILHRVAARFPRHVLVWPVRVQGETSGAEVAAAIRGFNLILDAETVRRPHLIIVARGGGSLEDLWGFNDEAVVRAVAEGSIPLISAVGHETDWTLIDHAADLRAPTPTGAAELALPVLSELLAAADTLRARQNSAMLRRLDRSQVALRSLLRVMPLAAELLAVPRQRIDRAAVQMPAAGEAHLNRLRLALSRAARRLGAQSPQARTARALERVKGLADRLRQARAFRGERNVASLASIGRSLEAAMAGRVRLLQSGQMHDRKRLDDLQRRLSQVRRLSPERGQARLAGLDQMLVALSYRGVLARGYALIQDGDGRTLRSAKAVREASRYTLELADGRISGQVTDGDAAVEPAPVVPRPTAGRRRSVSRTPFQQKSLFED